ncbi:MAG: Bax inhibitor-1/YccA family protein [Fimbriimonadaceae bacterium]|nr:Bax inhibitor-1/YccA family protein [Fimbriimonadaceae bacterium]
MALRTSNPTLREEAFSRYAYLTGTDPSARMTLSGTLNKCLLLATILLCSASVTWVYTSAHPEIVFPATIASAVVGLILCIATCFAVQASPYLAPAYALVEGVFVGVISMLVNTRYPGIAAQAFVITISIMVTMLGLYRSGLLKATPMFIKVVTISTLGIAVVYLLSWAFFAFGAKIPYLHDSTPLGIGISVVIIVIAAMNFIIDFDTIERGVDQGAPKYMEWYAAFGLMVTLVWLYIEVLRLLRKLRN